MRRRMIVGLAVTMLVAGTAMAEGGYLGSGNRADDGVGTIGSGTRSGFLGSGTRTEDSGQILGSGGRTEDGGIMGSGTRLLDLIRAIGLRALGR